MEMNQKFCAQAYNPRQVSLFYLEQSVKESQPEFQKYWSPGSFGTDLQKEGIDTHVLSVRVERLLHMNTSWEVDMATLEGYTQLLTSGEHTIMLYLS